MAFRLLRNLRLLHQLILMIQAGGLGKVLLVMSQDLDYPLQIRLYSQVAVVQL